MFSTLVQRVLTLIYFVFLLSGCTGIPQMSTPENLTVQPEIVLKKNHKDWDKVEKGFFTIGDIYQGIFSRNIGKGYWYKSQYIHSGDTIVEILRTDTREFWLMTCNGGDESVFFAPLSFGEGQPYQCLIFNQGQQIGKYRLAESSSALNVRIIQFEMGFMQLQNNHFSIESVHNKANSLPLLPTETPLGYRFLRGKKVMATIQTESTLRLNTIKDLSEPHKNTIVLGAIASALRWWSAPQ
ncbi:hypothetical protein MHO82_19205 [Vibrio sp. Of7-15]|uniref:hypothetical protein n=1 Tax=Vibrio sp. Of7-15 TaxID=2724879 RepID=UPI001EF2F1F6|nr:hypothetical protein [Vibrio sp. Of7-15]MCG7498999.1 hypothetical protein [Vibrio sp. Of7-15]